MFVRFLSVPINHEHRDSTVRTSIRRNIRVEQTKCSHMSTRPQGVSSQKASILTFSAVGPPGLRLLLWTKTWHILMLVCAGNEQKRRLVRLWNSLYRVSLSMSLSIFMFPSLLFACYLRTSYSVGWWVHLARNELRRTGGRRSPAYFESPLSLLCNSSFVCHLPLLYLVPIERNLVTFKTQQK